MANPYLNDAFFEAMRRQLRDQVEGQRRRASRGAETSLARRGLFGESTVAAQAFAGIGGESTRAIGEGETAIQGMEFKRDLERFLIEQQRPSFIEQALPIVGQASGQIAAAAIGAPVPGQSRGQAGSTSSQDPFGILGQGASRRDYLAEAQQRYKTRRDQPYMQAARTLGGYQP